MTRDPQIEDDGFWKALRLFATPDVFQRVIKRMVVGGELSMDDVMTLAVAAFAHLSDDSRRGAFFEEGSDAEFDDELSGRYKRIVGMVRVAVHDAFVADLDHKRRVG